MSPFSYIRLSLRPPEKKPPPKNFVDVYFDPEQGVLVAEDDQGTRTPIGSSPSLVLDTAPVDGVTQADYLGQDAIVNEEEFYKNVRLDPVKWVGPFPA